MDTPKQETVTEAEYQESLAILVRNLPKPVQDFLTGPRRDEVVLELSRKYKLHADQAGKFEKAFIHMLLGIMSPDEFVRTLTERGIDKAIIQGLAKDVNEQVFMPLRHAEEQSGVAPAAPVAAAPTQTEWVQVTPPMPAPAAPMPIQSAPPPPAPQPVSPAMPPAPAYAPQQLPSYQPGTPVVPTPAISTPPPSVPIGHTMAADMEAARLHTESAASVGMQPAPPQAQQWGSPAPAQSWQTAPAAPTYAPPPLPPQTYMPPGYWPAQPAQAYPVPSQPVYNYPPPQPAAAPPPPTPVPAPETTATPLAPPPSSAIDPRGQAHERFGLDPYREPII